MIRAEAERQFYLGAAGIRLWYARQSLPGAAPSPEFEFPCKAAAEAPLPTSEPAVRPGAHSVRGGQPVTPGGDRNDGAARIADLQALMEGGRAARERDAREAPKPGAAITASQDAPEPAPVIEAAGPVQAGEVEKVSLMLWAGTNVALIADMSADASNRLQENLALNILKSLGEQETPVLGRIRWPVFNNLLVPGNTSEDLAELMQSVLAGLSGQKVVVLGIETGSGHDWLTEALGRDAAIRFEHSLAQLAGNPALKRSLWHQLKPLAGQ
ncbi:hypothetical protein [Marinobacter subterrani]|uniref:2-isopropylmalate synthase n=1 Tax=Marinobacter subterrani TaxID=1658765 RepID=A0A0J7J6X0_9GAMM|nr:hypothetical protein [Marinobacter subterrani]KMQ73656.1 hypothetical protein Msub_20875 [Marinobacter subterrani]